MARLYNFNSRRIVELKDWKIRKIYMELVPLNLDNNTYAQVNTKYSEDLTAAFGQIDWSDCKNLELHINLSEPTSPEDAETHYDYICAIVSKLLLHDGLRHKEWRLSVENKGINIPNIQLLYLINYNTFCECFNLVLEYKSKDSGEIESISLI